jgi:hypothetical protein
MGRVATTRGRTLGREPALFLADHDRDLDDAACGSHATPPRATTFTDDALAWTLFKRGDLAPAKRAIAGASGSAPRAVVPPTPPRSRRARPHPRARGDRLARQLDPVDATVRTAYRRDDA